jgi:putative membrane protein
MATIRTSLGEEPTPMTNSIAPTKIGKASDHLANERTFLAWIATSISIIVFGFFVAKFGITLREFLTVPCGRR